MRQTRMGWWGGLAAALALVAVATCTKPPATHQMRVVVTVPALKGLIETLVPPGSQVTALIAPGRSEHGYDFAPSDAAAVADADVVVYVGLGLDAKIEQLVKSRPNPHQQVVCMASAVGADHPVAHDDDHTDRGPAGEPEADDGHHHGPIDPHLWLDPSLVLKLAPALDRAVAAAVNERTGAQPPGALANLEAAIRSVDAECRSKLAPLAGQAIVTHHAAWGRFANHFGLRVAAVIRPIETSEPTAADLNGAVDAIKKQGARAVFVEPQFNGDAASRIAAQAGVKVGRLDPLGDGDWFKLMRDNTDSLVRMLGR